MMSIRKKGGKLLNNIEVFDIYEGDKIGSDEVSLVFRLTFADKDSTLTDAEEVNNGKDFDKMWEQFEEFNKNEITAYNLLQFYLSRCLKNRFHPHIGIAGNDDFSLNDLLRAHLAKPLDFDSNHFDMLGRPDSYKAIFDKIISGKSEWSIYAIEYGIALSIILNDLKNKGCLDTEIINRKTK